MVYGVLPLTIVTLFILMVFELEGLRFGDEILGALAVMIGLTGILLFYIYLYKFEYGAYRSVHKRPGLLVFHALSVVILCASMHFIGHHSPWSAVELWGNYELHLVSKLFIMGIVIAGAISFIGILLVYYGWMPKVDSNSR